MTCTHVGRNKLWCVLTAILIFLCVHSVNGIEATFTHADPEGERSLPLSQNLRDKISELDQIISSSENPQETLMKIAESNNMDPNQLVQMINSNRRDAAMAQAKSTAIGTSLPRKLLAAIFQLIFVTPFRLIPAKFWLLIGIALYVTVQGPRTGVELVGPTNKFGALGSNSGWTTIFKPPTNYLHSSMERHYDDLYDFHIETDSNKILDRLELLRNQTSPKKKKKKKGMANNDDGVQIHYDLGGSKKKSKKNQQNPVIISANYNVDIQDLLSLLEKQLKDDNVDNEVKDLNEQVALEQIMSAAKTIFSSRRLSEFVPTKTTSNIVTYQDDKDAAVWVLPKLGGYNRYAITPLMVSCEEDKTDDIDGSCILSYTVPESLLLGDDAQLDFSCTWTKDDKAQVRVTLLLLDADDSKSRHKMLSKLCDGLSQSVAKSIVLQAKQTLSRQLQSKNYSKQARARAAEKRTVRHNSMVKLEEMAEKRRRRWQRNNPDAGHYRPSGFRMQSPNNC